MSGSRHTTPPEPRSAPRPEPRREPRPEPDPGPEPSDGDLIRRLRAAYAAGDGDPAACERLYRRHRAAAFACARRCSRAPQDAEDLVSEAFIRTLQAVRSGAGPREVWRPYLLSVVRRTAVEWRECAGRTVLTPDVEAWCRPGPDGDDPQRRLLASEDRRLVARSFQGLPERWRAVLWHTLVEDDCPHPVPLLLGITPSAVTSLAFRAREGLREAYLRAHLDTAADARCRHYGSLLGAVIRRRGTTPRGRGLARHLAACRSCSRAYAELLDLNAALRAGAASAALVGR
ncbi:sigma-70 family RNA polymerase sigma factor [Streptomyces flavotricini]|uniref:Sigma-70 family RNA polymerase sigma factor n=1 Tax=Streptomyces flavotricini TaxID=66888 RepID=A0ABS8E192_9ACTN|nr:sigma-70 family RNA polymerase sigma factor [Streptomyces flavotricini]MCC0094831.1 sigma-70 family RNA polymerase sigma factor [Streptomyces flavotricini]